MLSVQRETTDQQLSKSAVCNYEQAELSKIITKFQKSH